MQIITKEKKYHYILFTLVILITAFMAAFSVASDSDKFTDTDNDNLSDYEEKNIYQTAFDNPDTDNDGYTDGAEAANDYSPLYQNKKMIDVDTDNDGLNDMWEIKLGTNLKLKDSDDDGFEDWAEVYSGYSPTNPKPEKINKTIEVSIKDFKLQYFFGETLLETFLVSTGKPSTPTPKGKFSIINKVPVKYYTGYPNTKWNLHFTTAKSGLRYYIHGAYWHNFFGEKNVSGGCVNVPYTYMERLYNWANEGTNVIIK